MTLYSIHWPGIVVTLIVLGYVLLTGDGAFDGRSPLDYVR